MKLSDWLNLEEVADRLTALPMRPEAASLAAECFVQSALALNVRGIGDDAEVVACWAPGRIEVFGKHTDYCGGQSLLAAAELGFCMLAIPHDDRSMRVVDARSGEESEFGLRSDLDPVIGHWSNYPQTVARRVAANFPTASRGATIAFASNLPPAAGMSSSSAFIVGTFLLLSSINRLSETKVYRDEIHSQEDLAGYISTIENGLSFGELTGHRGVGTFGGSEDQTAILCGKANQLVAYSYCPVRYQRKLPVSDRYLFAVASSGVAAEKTGAALELYNRVSALARAIVELWQKETSGSQTSLAAVLESSPDAKERLVGILKSSSHESFMPNDMIERLEHFWIENYEIQSQLPVRLDASTAEKFGELAVQSHRAADRLLKNQTPETNGLVEMAIDLGALGASAFGAGFGGSVWALIEAAQEREFLASWEARYGREFPGPSQKAAFSAMRPGPPAAIFECA